MAKGSIEDRLAGTVAKAQLVEPELTLAAQQLLTFHGLANAMGSLLERSKTANDRDENASMNVEAKVLKMFGDVYIASMNLRVGIEKLRTLQSIEDKISRKEQNAGTGSADDFAPPRAQDRGAHQ